MDNLFLFNTNPLIEDGVPLSLFEFYQTIIKIPDAKNFLKSTIDISNQKGLGISEYEKYINSINYLYDLIHIDALDNNILFATKATNFERYLSLSDKLYLRYQFEQMFAPYTISCIYKNISQLSNTPFSLSDQININRIATCLHLPNVFTRQYILQMAFDTLKYHSKEINRNHDFFTKYSSDANIIARHVSRQSDYMHRNNIPAQWLDQYENFTSYLSLMLFPILENYFLITMWKWAEKEFNNVTDRFLYLYRLFCLLLNDEASITKLLSTEEILCNPPYGTKLPQSAIIYPCFTQEYIDKNLYSKCLRANHLHPLKNIPDFISLKYLNSYVEKAPENIQSLYIANTLAHT